MELRRAIQATIVSYFVIFFCLWAFFSSGAWLTVLDLVAGKEIKVTKAQVEERIQNDLPKHATKSEVEAFVDGLTINNVKLTRYDYHEGEPGPSDYDAPERPHPNVAEHFLANIPDNGYDGVLTSY